MPPVKRLNYFKFQFLNAEDFIDEQAYHLEMRRRHNRALHTPGIAQGLRVRKAESDATTVIVESGTAVDNLGQEIVLSEDRQIDPALFPSSDTFYLSAEYDQQETDLKSAVGLTGEMATRITEAPRFAATVNPSTDPGKLQLAKITRDPSSKQITVVDEGGRQIAGSVEGDVALNPRDPKIDSSKWVRLRWGAPNLADVDGSLHVVKAAGSQGNLAVDGQVKAGSLTIADTGGNVFPDNLIGMASNIEGTSKWLHIGGITDSGARRLALVADRTFVSGSLGIGTTAPAARLHIGAGDLRWSKSTLRDDQGGSIELGGTDGVPGAGTPYIDFHFNGLTEDFNTRLINDANGRLSVAAKVVHVPGQLAVGTTNPGRGLHVEGTEIHSGGKDSGLSFGDRGIPGFGTQAGQRWVFYSSSQVARLWTEVVGDVLTLTHGGTLTVPRITCEARRAPAFAAGWGDYGNPWAPVRFYKDPFGIVHMEGLATKLAGVPNFGEIILTLPSGYRPPAPLLFAVQSGEPNGVGRVDVHPDGRVVFVSGQRGEEDYQSLSTIHFRAAEPIITLPLPLPLPIPTPIPIPPQP